MTVERLKKYIGTGRHYFAPEPSSGRSNRSLLQARIFIATTLVIIGINISTILYFSSSADLPTRNAVYANIASSVVLMACFSALIIYRSTASIRIPALILITMLYLVSTISIIFLGGPLEGVTVTLMFVPPLIAFVFTGFVSGLTWTFLSYLALLVASIAQLKGYEFPFISIEEHKLEGRLVIWHFAFFSVFSIVAFYEHSNARYRKLLEQQAHHDPLTGLANRAALDQYLQQSVMRSRRGNGHFAVIYIDLDNFKPINDRHGHRMGDEVLKVLGTRLSRTLRQDEFCGRIGGDEFVVLTSTRQESIQPLLERLEKTLQEPIHVHDHNISLTASMGVAVYPHDGQTIEALVEAADAKMYQHKLSKRTETN